VEDVCEDVVIVSRGRIVASGPIDELKSGTGRQHLEIEVIDGGESWLDGEGLTILEREGDRVKLLVDQGTDLEAILAAARAAGEVRRFSFQPPRLSELFVEAVTEPTGDDPPAEAATDVGGQA
jgi:ABC-2 type transport system ATP-binding protein